MNKLELPRDEIAFRKIYKDLIIKKKITTVFRPGKRICGDFRGYCSGEIIKIRIIEKIGADWAMLPPKFEEEFIKKIEIVEIKSFPVKDLQEDDFNGSSPDVFDKGSLIHQLGIIYNLSIEELQDDSLITKITFKYVD
ncbi:MAG: hypothetical protein PHN69_04770 [Candidatus Pacebacteria bacterium]|nr:hypothetical protein [Candidatus Paceibacterota bacterium]